MEQQCPCCVWLLAMSALQRSHAVTQTASHAWPMAFRSTWSSSLNTVSTGFAVALSVPHTRAPKPRSSPTCGCFSLPLPQQSGEKLAASCSGGLVRRKGANSDHHDGGSRRRMLIHRLAARSPQPGMPKMEACVHLSCNMRSSGYTELESVSSISTTASRCRARRT
ncbi:hypothetical protein FQA47_006722 [Oryzias melastigma]|uniref:Secreted protein n=1 Tax=Oryzias melastigma TaxID=30732 RepID=A0A834CJ41_ORYME|nr:hypothetical protein FQA47_006722 [Oryzias melastigma]